MAIYSVNHGSIGRTTHGAGTAGAHARYILRPQALTQVLGMYMPTGRNAAMHWLNEQEGEDRKNARVIDKLRLALPIELSREQRAELVREFANEITQGKTPWLAAIHAMGKDEHNPHAHLILRDRDIETGRRLSMLSERGSTERLRAAWELAANRALERAGLEMRIDRRSLLEQGIGRAAGIHIGPASLAMETRFMALEMTRESRQRVVTLIGGKTRVIDYPAIDSGRSRADRQREIEHENELAAQALAQSRGRALEQDMTPEGKAFESSLTRQRREEGETRTRGIAAHARELVTAARQLLKTMRGSLGQVMAIDAKDLVGQMHRLTREAQIPREAQAPPVPERTPELTLQPDARAPRLEPEVEPRRESLRDMLRREALERGEELRVELKLAPERELTMERERPRRRPQDDGAS